MFTGIVEELGEIVELNKEGSLLHIWVKSDFVNELRIDQSVAHNGICLTVDELLEYKYRVTAIQETIQKTTISSCKVGDKVNLERCLKLGDRLDGHIVQGHIDAVAKCVDVVKNEKEIVFEFSIHETHSNMIVEKGSVTLDGISLTCHSVNENKFKVSIIPYTYENTNAQQWGKDTLCNIEFDIVGKYISRNLKLNQ